VKRRAQQLSNTFLLAGGKTFDPDKKCLFQPQVSSQFPAMFSEPPEGGLDLVTNREGSI